MSIRALFTASAMLLGSAPPLSAEPFTILIYESDPDLAARTDPARAKDYWASYAAFAGAMQQAGILKGGQALRWGDDARTVRVGGSVTNGPVAVAAEQLGGYFMIDVPDLDAALSWAARAPAAATGAVEVRPAHPAPAMR
ncbi:MAG: YciI family protein [Geminicoccaceae bacterium]